MKLTFLIILIFMISQEGLGAVALPQNMTDGEQELLLQILGFSTSFRPVDNPYPLGGYSGLELGLAFEDVPTGDVGYFGNKASVNRDLIYPRITLGKGIFANTDLFFSFIPYNESTGIGIYSGGLRWGFFQATFVPAAFSLLISATNTNVGNLFISQTEGVDLISGVNVNPFSFYVGAGTLYGQGQFDATLTSGGSPTNKTGRSFHTLIGMNFTLSEFFSALEVDTYSTTTASIKIGTRL